ncbi:MAG: glycosyltransferase [Pseudomonadota bacterium]
MKVWHTVPSIEEEASGPSYTVPRLCSGLAKQGVDITLATLGERQTIDRKGFLHERFPQSGLTMGPLKKLGFSGALNAALQAANAQIYHSHGLWMMPNVYPAKAARRNNAVLMMTPRGMFGEEAMQFSARKKQIFWSLYQGAAARSADCFHATSDSEAEDIRRQGLTQPICIIPNGIDIPELRRTKQSRPDAPFALSLGRIHPKKGLDRLIRAWAKLPSQLQGWRLKIVGPSELGHAYELEVLAQSLKARNISVEPPVFGDEKIELMRSAELFVLPTLNENFAMTVAESLAVATPVVSTRGAPWEGLTTHQCGWWIEHGVEPMRTTLEDALSLSIDQRASMGLKGQAWMKDAFSWTAISQDMLATYQWLQKGGARPDHVFTD